MDVFLKKLGVNQYNFNSKKTYNRFYMWKMLL